MNEPRNVWSDRRGARHVVTFTVGKARRLKTECGLDVLSCLADQSGLKTICDQLAPRPDLMLEALAIVHEVPDDQSTDFYDQIDGDTFEAASAAFLYGLIDFFPQQSRKVLTRLLETSENLANRMNASAETSILERLGKQDFISEIESFATAGNGSKT
jgi:hypothetical protein